MLRIVCVVIGRCVYCCGCEKFAKCVLREPCIWRRCSGRMAYLEEMAGLKGRRRSRAVVSVKVCILEREGEAS